MILHTTKVQVSLAVKISVITINKNVHLPKADEHF